MAKSSYSTTNNNPLVTGRLSITCMKHLKRFNESKSNIEAHFKSRIDWKFITQLLELATPYEDQGYDVGLTLVLINRYESLYTFIYNYSSTSPDSNGYVGDDDISIQSKEQWYKENGILYWFSVYKDEDTNTPCDDIALEIINKLENKCESIDDDYEFIEGGYAIKLKE